jgi:K(+)-stimulated pyrophosphate-energized sodium pump
MKILYVVPVSCLLAIAFAYYFTRYIFSQPKGNEKMQGIAAAIKEGAMAFLSRQYTTIAVLSVAFAVIFTIALGLTSSWASGIKTAVAFLLGAFCSALAGYIGMYVAVHANLRAAAGAHESFDKALKIALWGGAVTGLCVVALSLIGVSALFLLYGGKLNPLEAPFLIVGYGFGASFVALFAQLGGGIFTKAADVGADLVGKVEAGIPEDDPRNPAVIADLVGDNVGDCAGRGADLFESTAAENIGAMIIGVALFPTFGIKGILFPLVARAFGLIASIVGLFFVKVKESEDPMNALKRGYFVTCALAAAFLFIACKNMLGVYYLNFFGCALTGLVMSIMFVYVTDYYTSYRFSPVKRIAESSLTGAGTTIITGLSVGLECTGIPVIVISLAILISYMLGHSTGLPSGGIYGTAIATMGMLATCAYILAMDTFGPITDNAGGIIEMSNAPEDVRKRTDRLDACGNTTKALTKGYAIGSAALAAFLLFSAYMNEVAKLRGTEFNIVNIGKVEVFVGAMLGAVLVFVFSAFAIRAVGNAAYYIIKEVRRQFKEIPGIMEGKAKPEYGTCVDIVTKGALKQMVLPGLIAILSPIVVGLLLRAEAVAAFLMVGTITGVIVATFMNNGGGAWDNAKKFIELGNYGGKKSEAHKAAVVGDTVGDPLKDTAGPSIHVLIKLLSTITLVLASLFI